MEPLITIIYIVVFIGIMILSFIQLCVQKYYETNNKIIEYQKIYSSIRMKNYNELREMHHTLVLLLNERSETIGWKYCDYLISKIQLPLKESEYKMDSIKRDKIPLEKQVFGCAYYSDAKRLDEAIIKRIHELSGN